MATGEAAAGAGAGAAPARRHRCVKIMKGQQCPQGGRKLPQPIREFAPETCLPDPLLTPFWGHTTCEAWNTTRISSTRDRQMHQLQ